MNFKIKIYKIFLDNKLLSPVKINLSSIISFIYNLNT